MTHALHLDPGSYTGSYKLIGGALALDFANLVSYRGTAREHDWLEPAANLRLWTGATRAPQAGPSDVATMRAFREVLARVFLAVVDRATPDAADIARIDARCRTAVGRRRLVFSGDGAGWVDDAPTLIGTLALDAAELLTSASRMQRLSACAECRWLFLDTTRNHSRRWCDPADCGNRARQRRHYRKAGGVGRADADVPVPPMP